MFGCVAYVHNPTHKTNKWSAKAFKCVFLGYSTTQKRYKLYHPVTRKYLVSKDVVFDETIFYYKSDHHESLRDLGYLKLLDQTCLLEEEPQTPILSNDHLIPSLPEETVVTSTPSARDNPESESAAQDQTSSDHPEVMDHHQSPPP